MNKNKIYFYGFGAVLSAIVVSYLFFPSVFRFVLNDGNKTNYQSESPKKVIVEEKMSVPETKNISQGDGMYPNVSEYKVPLEKEEGKEEMVFLKAVLTLKNSYDLAEKKAMEWSGDAKLIFIKSMGAVDNTGKSSQWQIAFGSELKKGGYEVIIHEDKIISAKEVESAEYGYSLPSNWYDSNEAIASLNGLSGFVSATISGISFYYNADGKIWKYALVTSAGNTSMNVK